MVKSRANERRVQPVHQYGARKATKVSIALVIDVLFWFFHYFLVHSTQIHSLERSFSLFSDPKALLFHLAKPLLEALLQIHHHNSFFTTYNKVKKSITSSEKFQKFNRKIVKIGKIDIPNTHIHDHSLFWLSTCTSVKSDGVKLDGL
jgi:hypothetical protein